MRPRVGHTNTTPSRATAVTPHRTTRRTARKIVQDSVASMINLWTSASCGREPRLQQTAGRGQDEEGQSFLDAGDIWWRRRGTAAEPGGHAACRRACVLAAWSGAGGSNQRFGARCSRETEHASPAAQQAWAFLAEPSPARLHSGQGCNRPVQDPRLTPTPSRVRGRRA